MERGSRGGSAIAVMMLTCTAHPPAGSNPVILFPTLKGAVILVLIALVVHKLTRQTRWPNYW